MRLATLSSERSQAPAARQAITIPFLAINQSWAIGRALTTSSTDIWQLGAISLDRITAIGTGADVGADNLEFAKVATCRCRLTIAPNTLSARSCLATRLRSRLIRERVRASEMFPQFKQLRERDGENIILG